MVKRFISLIATTLISLTPLFVFAPKAHAAAFTWSGTDCPAVNCEFSRGGNWVGGVAPGDGDNLIFPASAMSDEIINNDTTFTYSGISFTGTPSCGTDEEYVFTGSQPLNVSGDIINDLAPSSCGNVTFDLDMNLTGNLTINGDSYIIIGTDNTTTLALGTSDVIMQGAVSVESVITGGATSSITVSSSSDLYTSAASPAFHGQLVLNGGLSTYNGGFGSATGNTTVNSGGYICYDTGLLNSTIAEPFVFNEGVFNTDYAIFAAWPSCGAGGVGASNHTNEVTTLSGSITIVEDTYLNTFGTIAITGSVTGNFNFKLPYGSYGILDLASGDVEAEAREVTVANGDNSSAFVNIENKETYIVNGTRGDVSINRNGVLKGSGTVADITVYEGGKLAPGQSPGCLNSGNLAFQSGSTYEFEVGGATECTEYDQTKVTGTVDLGNGTLSLVRFNDFKPVAGQSYKIIDNDSNDAVTGTFNNLAQGATFTVDGYVFSISYTGGDGNDVVVTVQSVPTTPNTGFELLRKNPFVIFTMTTALAAAIALLARRYNKLPIN